MELLSGEPKRRWLINARMPVHTLCIPAAVSMLLAGQLQPTSSASDISDAASVSLAVIPAALSFQSFFSHACHAGLHVVRSYDAPTLLDFAEQALVLEQKLATGCFLLQAVLLVEHYFRTTTIPYHAAAEQERGAQDFGQ